MSRFLPLAVLGAASLALAGCYVAPGPRGVYVAPPVVGVAVAPAVVFAPAVPPPPRYEVVPALAPGYAWEPGHWGWDGVRWAWVGGYRVAPRPGFGVWVGGHWAHARDGWHWQGGHWR